MSLAMKNKPGMAYIARLLASPGRSFSSSELVLDVSRVSPATRGLSPEEKTAMPNRGFGKQALLDQQGCEQFGKRMEQIERQLSEAAASHNEVGVEELKIEKEQVVAETRRVKGPGGRRRSFSDNDEKARQAVRRAIKRSIDEGQKLFPALADHLVLKLKLGYQCRYVGDGVSWRVTGEPDIRNS